ncbi:hypothetical protein ACFSQ7_14680 [Paenibacillus rhizoplanae]
MQNSFIAIIIMLAALLLSTAVSVLNNTNRMYESIHDQSRGAHQILQMENGIHDPVEIHKWWEEEQGVTVSDLMRYRYLSSMSHAGEEIPNADLFMMDAPTGPFSRGPAAVRGRGRTEHTGSRNRLDSHLAGVSQ